MSRKEITLYLELQKLQTTDNATSLNSQKNSFKLSDETCLSRTKITRSIY